MYKIYLLKDINGLEYVGITTQTLNKRLYNHRGKKKIGIYYSSSKLDLDNCVIELLEETDDPKREQYWINNIDCVNDRNAFIDKKEYHNQYSKQYNKTKYAYQNSWGGRTDVPNNSLLKIDPNLFID